jgi:DNA polymerase
MSNAIDILKEISNQVAFCEKCKLHLSRKHSVPGEGPHDAEILFIGEGPGFYENEQGRPFVGQAGKFLDELLVTAGFTRSSVFITNVVKCRPPENRDPELDELTACSVYLDKQIETINPHVIVTLGRISMAKFLPNVRISLIHGQPSWVNDQLVVPMYHPAAALHQPSLKSTIITDFSNLPKAIEQAKRFKPHTEANDKIEKIEDQTHSIIEPPAEQLSLF